MGVGSPSIVPYCGAAPSPDTLWERWNIDPVLLAALALLACFYALGAVRLRRRNNPASGREKLAFYGGWAVATAALISPLCPLSVSLFAARVGQHMILALIAAPLVAAGRPAICLAALWPSLVWQERSPHARATAAPLTAAGLFAALLWFWHAPAPYAATFTSALVYWSMHVSLFGSALFLWSNLLDPAPSRMMRTVAAGAVSSLQMGFLGALITLAPTSALCAACADHRRLGTDAAPGPAARRRHHVGPGLPHLPRRRPRRAVARDAACGVSPHRNGPLMSVDAAVGRASSRSHGSNRDADARAVCRRVSACRAGAARGCGPRPARRRRRSASRPICTASAPRPTR